MEFPSELTSSYIQHLMKAQHRCLAAMDAMHENIEASKEFEYMFSGKDIDALKVISALILQVTELKKSEKNDYVNRLKSENSMLRSLNNLSPLSKTPPPLVKPNQYGFMSADYDIEKLELSKKAKEKALQSIDNIIGSDTLSVPAVRALVQAKNIIKASHMEDTRLVDNFWAYRQRTRRKDMNMAEGDLASPCTKKEQKKRKQDFDEFNPSKVQRQDSCESDFSGSEEEEN